MAVQLTILRGPQHGTTHTFEDDIVTIGSGRTNSLVILDNDVSTNHCRLMRIETDYDIEDLGSRYGTFVNGQPLEGERWVLKNGSIIELGSQITIEYRQTELDPYDHGTPVFIKEGDPGSQPCLVLVENATIKQAYLLRSEEIAIGRSETNDIVIQNSDISRVHARLIWQDLGYQITDLKSRNGTYLNGVTVSDSARLQHSDVIRLGASTQFHYIYRSDLPEAWDPVATDSSPDKIATQDLTLPKAKARKEASPEIWSEAKGKGLSDHILITYAREDWEHLVAPIVVNLEDTKQNAWVDQHLQPGSDAWEDALYQAQTECWLLVVIATHKALKTDHVRELYRYFYNREKPIIVVEYGENTKLPFQLKQVPRIRYDEENPGITFRQVLYEIMQLKPQSL